MGALALVLHAHLPYVLEREPGRLEEGWLHEAVLDCYLPLCAMLERLAADGVTARFTLSVSPPLASMLRDPRFPDRFTRYLDALERRNANHAQEHSRAATHRAEQIAAGRADFSALGGDLLAAFDRHAASGRLELATTSLSHAYLPGLIDGAARELRLGRAAGRAALPSIGPGMWLPECALDRRVLDALVQEQVAWTVVGTRALDRTHARHGGVVFLKRDAKTAREVWSRRDGYPASPVYRAHHLDPALSRWAIGRGTPVPYDATKAFAQADRDADRFVMRRRRERASSGAPRCLPFDAELFGHWWAEGPRFLEQALRGIAADDDLEAVTAGELAGRVADDARPRDSSWGRGGHGDVWVGGRTSWMWRAVHQGARATSAACRRGRSTAPDAVREQALLQASDWAFMIDAGRGEGYARMRHEAHGDAVAALTDGHARARRWHGFAELPDDLLVEAWQA